MPRRARETVAFGDFQTPDALALEATRLVAALGFDPGAVIEPTCGRGAFLSAAATVFPRAALIGVDINPDHVAEARTRLPSQASLHTGDFFTTAWPELLAQAPQPWLILGNPPWVTTAAGTRSRIGNRPKKGEPVGLRGLEAVTGKSNFDISEWMLLRMLTWLTGRAGVVAMICKTAVARKVLARGWRDGGAFADVRLYRIPAAAWFDVAVDACILIVRCAPGAAVTTCAVYDSLSDPRPSACWGFDDGRVIADVVAYQHARHLLGGSALAWRSGIKHDCAAVMELTPAADGYVNGDGAYAALEPEYLYPLLKGTDIARGGAWSGRMMLVPQRATGDDTAKIGALAPATWAYLQNHRTRLEARASAIYRHRPPFAIFGVGPYTFSPWKVAISCLHKRLHFVCVGPIDGKPVVFDDTVAFLPCASADEARGIAALLMSPPVQSALNALVFWTDKRPITVDILNRLDLGAIADALAGSGVTPAGALEVFREQAGTRGHQAVI